MDAHKKINAPTVIAVIVIAVIADSGAFIGVNLAIWA
jgi:hypothetical protein